jgi:hypothetical protein
VREERTTNYTKRSDPDELGLWIDGRNLKLYEYVDEVNGYKIMGLGKARLRGVDWKGQKDWLVEGEGQWGIRRNGGRICGEISAVRVEYQMLWMLVDNNHKDVSGASFLTSDRSISVSKDIYLYSMYRQAVTCGEDFV